MKLIKVVEVLLSRRVGSFYDIADAVLASELNRFVGDEPAMARHHPAAAEQSDGDQDRKARSNEEKHEARASLEPEPHATTRRGRHPETLVEMPSVMPCHDICE